MTDIFDAQRSREEAARQLEDPRRLMDVEDEDGEVLLEFFKTYDAHTGTRFRPTSMTVRPAARWKA